MLASQKIVNSVSINEQLGVKIRLNWANDLFNIYFDEENAEKVIDELLKTNPTDDILEEIEDIRMTAPRNLKPSAPKIAQEQSIKSIPDKYSLASAYPNPFNPSTTFKYNLPKTSNIEIDIYNTLGQRIKSYSMNGKEPGSHQITWYGKNSNGWDVPSGIYFFRFHATSLDNMKDVFEKSLKITLIR